MDQQQETTNDEMQKSNTPYSKSLIGIVIALVILAFAAGAGFMTYYNSINKPQVKIENPTTNKPDTQIEDTANSQIAKEIKKLPSSDIPPASNLQGGILLSKDGYGKQAAGAPTVATYFDPLCPGCGNFNRTVDETLIKMVEAGQINLELHPMSFLDGLSTDHYSTRVSSAIAYIASYDNDPKHLLQFINGIFNEKFQPEEGEGYQATPNKALIDLAEDAGVANKIANEAFNLHYVKW
ncbi:DsbA family protein, partial [Gardnerella leopoldii]|uniref:DsbA family protein n=1 Tax=Gardnerella leopoldii TaxID=2792978 RepID=UPI0039EFB121